MPYASATVVLVFADGAVKRIRGDIKVGEATVHDVVKVLAEEPSLSNLLEWDYEAFLNGKPMYESAIIPQTDLPCTLKIKSRVPRKGGS